MRLMMMSQPLAPCALSYCMVRAFGQDASAGAALLGKGHAMEFGGTASERRSQATSGKRGLGAVDESLGERCRHRWIVVLWCALVLVGYVCCGPETADMRLPTQHG